MPTYSFVCDKGHVTDEVFIPSHRPKTIRCSVKRCRRRATYSFGATHQNSSIGVDNDCPVHYNPTIGMVVRSRKHLRDIQKRAYGEHGIEMQNYEPVKRRERREVRPLDGARWGERGRE